MSDNAPADPVTIRMATPVDAAAIGSLHAASWMKTYRGILPDEYLENDLTGERIAYWQKKMHSLSDKEFVLIAELQNEVVGFICVLDRPQAGYDAFVDNLHVSSRLKGKGIGTILMQHAAAQLERTGRSSFYLWVLEGNAAAEKFYLSRGATRSDISTAEFGGVEVRQTRFGWERWSVIAPDSNPP